MGEAHQYHKEALYPCVRVIDCFDRGYTKQVFGTAYDIATLAVGGGTIDVTTAISHVTMVTGAIAGNQEGLRINDPVAVRSREYYAEISCDLAQIAGTEFRFGFYAAANEYCYIEFDASENANWRLTVDDTTGAQFATPTGGAVAPDTVYLISLWVETDGTPHWMVGTEYFREQLLITDLTKKMTASAHYVQFWVKTEANAAKTAEVCHLETIKAKEH
ncbi:hypothetical protein ES703_21909 [subsurface metagenome]